ncbi:septum formation initiator family protein [Bdellovibrio reynosensis]|uniref:Septum formation initiator family protein n=1 Tax=Bdellovibrio reynosensis TaxID=2835041 RepID=A0ABY4C4E7_9BACT|nr:septum formation initiator family protein [Bdellovibrio reynosensis]UOE99732.1 septum formation initiator family protein [Bdellovibrio reynosensis]
MSYTEFAIGLRRFLNHPTKVASVCLIVFCVSIVLNGNVFRLWNLHRDFDRINSEISATKQNISTLSDQLKQAKDPSFIERQARDRLDLAGEDDLVFVFAEQD